MNVYLALGDSMSIDTYTGVVGGGAVKQFYHSLPAGRWRLNDLTYDGCIMSGVDRSQSGDLITLTIGGNDLLLGREHYLRHGLRDFADEHLRLLQNVRRPNPQAVIIVGNIYEPQSPLSDLERTALQQANEIIAENTASIDAQLADIHSEFQGSEDDYLCFDIEPTLKGAAAIAALFRTAYAAAP